MNVISHAAAVDFSATPALPDVPQTSEPDADSSAAFSKLLFAGAPQSHAGSLSVPQMLVQQAATFGTTFSVDLGAKCAGVVSQSVNKLANMT